MDQLQFHLAFARRNGVTDDELKEALLQLAFYAGWPNGMGATTVLKNIIEKDSEACASEPKATNLERIDHE